MRIWRDRNRRRASLRRGSRDPDGRERAARGVSPREPRGERDPERGGPHRGCLRAGRRPGLRSHPLQSPDPGGPRNRGSDHRGSPVPPARRRKTLAGRPHPTRGRHASAPNDESLRRRRRGEAGERLQSPPVGQVGSVAMAAKPGPSRIRVRIVRPDDAPGLVPLFEAFYGAYFGGRVTETSGSGRLRQAANHETVLVAEVGDRIAGFASLRVTDSLDPAPYAELTDLFVETEARRLGVASRLGKDGEGSARERGAPHLVVLTGPKKTGGQAFYRPAGFARDAVRIRQQLNG